MDQSREQKALRALYSDETENYRFPIEPSAGDWVTIRFRTLKNSADMVWIVYTHPLLPGQMPLLRFLFRAGLPGGAAGLCGRAAAGACEL